MPGYEPGGASAAKLSILPPEAKPPVVLIAVLLAGVAYLWYQTRRR